MPECSVVVPNREGLQARNSANLVKLANSFTCNIRVSKDDEECNAKSIMGVMLLAAEQGSVLKIFTDGIDAPSALSALVDLIESGFQPA